MDFLNSLSTFVNKELMNQELHFVLVSKMLKEQLMSSSVYF